MKFVAFLTLLFLVSTAICQQVSDVELVSQAYEAQNPNESLEFLSQIKNIEVLSDTTLNRYYLSKGVAYGKLGAADSSAFYLEQCIQNASSTDDNYNLMRAHNSYGVLLRIQGRHEESLESFQSAEKILERHSEDRFAKAKSDILGNIGGIFYQLKDYSSARDYSKRGLETAMQYNDTSELAYGYLRLAIVAQAEDSLEQSLEYNKKASQFLEEFGDYNTLSYVQNNLGNIYKDQEDFEMALIHHKKANEYADILGDEETKAHTLISIAESYFRLGRFSQSRQYASQALVIAQERNFPIHSKNVHNLLFRIAEKQGNFKLALEENKLSVSINDSLNAAEARERLADVETKYETEKKEIEIKRLSLENQLKDSRILAGGIASGLVILLLIVFFTLRHKQQRIEKEAQELQIEALKKRFMELHSSPSELAVALDFLELNDKLHTPLTEREFDALKLSLEGKTNVEIGEKLFISVSTVKFHLRNTYSKMGVGNRKEAFQYMLKYS